MRGQDLYFGEAQGKFDDETVAATKSYQSKHGLKIDGVAGNATIGRAMFDGFEVLKSPETGKESPNWPPKPGDMAPASLALRQQLFGAFQYQPAPTKGNPEGIRILGTWERDNIIEVVVPQLVRIPGASSKGRISVHKKVAPQLVALFQAWQDAGLIDRVKTFGGSWAPRFVRGSRTNLSNHAFGSAFDLNVAWNQLSCRPALVGEIGSVRELVPLAVQYGFWWGGWFGIGLERGRPDGMHFECAEIISL